MAHMKQRVAVTLKLPQLQNLIKRDPDAYKEEFIMQKRHFDSELEIFKLRPTKDSERFTELVTFMSHVGSCYKDDCEALPTCIMELLETHANVLHPDVRAKLLQALIMLRNKDMIKPLLLIKLAFKLFSVNDKTLRISLGEYIFNDIKAINREKQNEKLNRSVQAVLFGVVEEDTTITARKTVEILCELYRRKIWTDTRTVNMIASACLSPATRVTVAAINFFLGIETKMHEDEEEEKNEVVKGKEIDYHAHSKKTKKRARNVQKQVERNEKLRRDAQKQKDNVATPLFPAIQMLHDPQSLAEKLFKKLRQSGERFEVKLLIMNFISRLIGCHKLLLLSFYSFLQRYLTSHQQEITHILAYLIQACHDLVPPEDLQPILKAIAYNFITERCSNEVVSVGINAVREILARAPALLREPDMADFIQDLALYGRKTHKSVMIAAHGLVNLVRELYPALLRKGDRGKHHNPLSQPAEYGQTNVADGVEGVELLEAYERGDILINGDDVEWAEDGGDKDNSSDMEEEEEDDDDEWEMMNDDEEDEEDEGRGASKKQKKSNSTTIEGDDEDEEDEGEWEDMDEDDDDEGSDDDSNDIEEEEEEEEEEVEIVAAPSSTTTTPAKSYSALNNIRGRIDACRVLSPADFALLDKLRAAQAERALDPKHRGKAMTHSVAAALKRKREENDANDEDAVPALDYAVTADSLAPGARAERSSKIERITNILEARKDKKKFEHEGHAGGLTNKEKLRKKNFMMVRKGKRSVSLKLRKSNSEQRWTKSKQKEQLGREKRKRRRT